MAQGRNTLMDPPIEDLLDKVDSKFTLVALGSARARQVNSYYNSLGEGLGRSCRRRWPPSPASRFRSPSRRSPPARRPTPGWTLRKRRHWPRPRRTSSARSVLTEVLTDDVVSSEIEDAIALLGGSDATDAIAADAIAADAIVTDAIVDDVLGDDVLGDDADSGEADIEVLDVGDEDPTAS